MQSLQTKLILNDRMDKDENQSGIGIKKAAKAAFLKVQYPLKIIF